MVEIISLYFMGLIFCRGRSTLRASFASKENTTLNMEKPSGVATIYSGLGQKIMCFSVLQE